MDIAALHKYQNIYTKVRMLIEHHYVIKRIKGETFNVFEILNLQTHEVRTHSSFIAELLNPKGSHLMGDVFLKSFISLLPDIHNFDTSNASVFVEFHIGKIDKLTNYGGRIDILIRDIQGQTICIENKIDASDQEMQVVRYCNYNTHNNTVIYLTKFGEDPDDSSRGNLESGKDFYNFSYENDIINWLNDCLELAYDKPILRESIKQYKLLISKITYQLDNDLNKDLENLIKKNIEESLQIANRFDNVVSGLQEKFRDDLFKALEEQKNILFPNYSIKKNKKPGDKHSGIWISRGNQNLEIGIECFSGRGNVGGILYIGVFKDPKCTQELHTELPNRMSNWWIHYEKLRFDNKVIKLSDPHFLKLLVALYDENSENLGNPFLEEVLSQIVDFLNTYIPLISKPYDATK